MIIRQAYPFDAAGIADVSVASWRTTYAGILPTDFLRNLSRVDREFAYEDRLSFICTPTSEFAYVAEDGDRIVGFAYAGPKRAGFKDYLGELYALYILKEYHGRDIGRRLVAEVARHFIGIGIDSMIVWALICNPACGFYQNLGGSIVSQSNIDIAGATLLKIAYGWRDIRTITQTVNT